jgi:hypothetical protein
MEKATTWLRPASPGFACFFWFLCFIWLMSSPSLFAVSKQERLLYGKKKGLYWVIICIGTKEVIKWKTYRQ